MPKGKYIVIEGADGTGKSTQVELLSKHLEEQGIRSVITQEPGGSPVSEKLRSIIKEGSLERDPWTNVMLFTASRRASWFQSIKPALDAGTWVIASRSYVSTIAYQGYGEGVDVQKIIQYTHDNIEDGYLNPDCLIILTLGDEDHRKSRIGERVSKYAKDTFESKDVAFQASMQAGYIAYAKEHGIKTVDASGTVEDIQSAIQKLLGL
jgi:dTMP kinase